MTRFYYILFIFFVLSCDKKNVEKGIDDNYQCQTEAAVRWFTQNDMTASFDNNIISKLATSNAADANGAMSRNKNGYFHVRFQMGISPVADFAVDAQNTTALEMAIKAIEYSFIHQNTSGDFEFVIPSDLANTGKLTSADSASAVSFFLSSLSSALLALNESSWFQAQTVYKNRINALDNNYKNALVFLKTKMSVLQQADADAPNRLLFDALAFYGMGKYCNDNQAMQTGIDFARRALSKQHEKGYFLEKNGWDSSYQGVGLSVGFRLLSILTPNETIQNDLYNSLACGTNWQTSRITTNGEISTKDNTRVYDGGEAFLGEEKKIAYTSTLIALWNMHYYTNNAKYNNIANNVLAYYD